MNELLPLEYIDRVTPSARAALAARALRRVLPLFGAANASTGEYYAQELRLATETIEWAAPQHFQEYPPHRQVQPYHLAAANVSQAAIAAMHLALPGNDTSPGRPDPSRYPKFRHNPDWPRRASPLADELRILLEASKSVALGIAGHVAAEVIEAALHHDLNNAFTKREFGPLWPSELIPRLSAVDGAIQWLMKTVGNYRPRPVVSWAYTADDGFPQGIQATVTVAAWGLNASRSFDWEEVGNKNYFRGELSALWGNVLGDYQRSLLRKIARPEAV